MTLVYDKQEQRTVPVDLAEVVPELLAAQGASVVPDPSAPRIVCPVGLRLTSEQAERIERELGLSRKQIDAYAAHFAATRRAQGLAGESGKGQPDMLTMVEWQYLIGASVVKQTMLAGYESNDGRYVVCPKETPRAAEARASNEKNVESAADFARRRRRGQ